jgi:hypothetical protein
MPDATKPAEVRLVPHVADATCSDAIVYFFKQFSTGVVSKPELSKELRKRKLRNFHGKLLTFPVQTLDNILGNIYLFDYDTLLKV